MRDYAEINADMQEARRKLQEIDMQLSQLSATARNSPFGREFGGYREQLLAKLRDLRRIAGNGRGRVEVPARGNVQKSRGGGMINQKSPHQPEARRTIAYDARKSQAARGLGSTPPERPPLKERLERLRHKQETGKS